MNKKIIISAIVIVVVILILVYAFFMPKKVISPTIEKNSVISPQSTDQNITQNETNNVIPKATIMIANNPTLGQILVDSNGMTLYTYTKDTINVSNCAGQCAINWPPLIANNNLNAGDSISGTINKIQRADGTSQVTYNGWPLYTWINDKAPGETTGQGVGGIWYVVEP